MKRNVLKSKMEPGTIQNNGARTKSLMSMILSTLLLFLFNSCVTLYYDLSGKKHTATVRGDISDTVYIVRDNNIWSSKLPATVICSDKRKPDTLKIFTANFEVNELIVTKRFNYLYVLDVINPIGPFRFFFAMNSAKGVFKPSKKSQKIEFRQADRTDAEKFEFYTNTGKQHISSKWFNTSNQNKYGVRNTQKFEETYALFQKACTFVNMNDSVRFEYWQDINKLIVSNESYEDMSCVQRIYDGMDLSNEKRAGGWIQLGEYLFDQESGKTQPLWSRVIPYLKKGYELSDIPKELCYYQMIDKGEFILNEKIDDTGSKNYYGEKRSFYMKSNNFNQAIKFFEAAQEMYPDNELAKRYITHVKNLKEQNEDERLQELAVLREEKARKEAAEWQKFASSLETLGTTINSMKTRNSTGSSGGNSQISSGNSSETGNRNANSNNKSKADCGQAWITDSRTYSNYDDQLVKMQTYPERYNNYTAEFSSVQSKMRQLRQKWENRGCLITKSPRE